MKALRAGGDDRLRCFEQSVGLTSRNPVLCLRWPGNFTHSAGTWRPGYWSPAHLRHSRHTGGI